MSKTLFAAVAWALFLGGFAVALLLRLAQGPSSGDCVTRERRDLETLSWLLGRYRQSTGSFPTTAQGLDVLLVRPRAPHPPGWPGLLEEPLRDPWGSPYVYRFPSADDPEQFELLSLGRGRVPSADDIRATPRTPEPATSP